MRRTTLTLLIVALALAGAAFLLTNGRSVDDSAFAGLSGDASRGETVFWGAGCASCHAAPESEERLVLSGGEKFPSDFGTFIAPNVSMDSVHGIGSWTLGEFATAVQNGVSPDAQHYYPAFPYGAYSKMTPQDVVDLWAFWQTLPASDTPNQPHQLGFPFTLRRGLALWKAVEQVGEYVVAEAPTPELERGRYLVEALAHCGDCHTPRTAFGGLDTARWMAGAPDPSGQGRIPGLTPAQLDWTDADIAYYLETGFTPDFDSVGGLMTSVAKNMAELTEDDRLAIAAYLKALPPAE